MRLRNPTAWSSSTTMDDPRERRAGQIEPRADERANRCCRRQGGRRGEPADAAGRAEDDACAEEANSRGDALDHAVGGVRKQLDAERDERGRAERDEGEGAVTRVLASELSVQTHQVPEECRERDPTDDDELRVQVHRAEPSPLSPRGGSMRSG